MRVHLIGDEHQYTGVELLAYDFAALAHQSIGQKRKYTGADYMVHPATVGYEAKRAGLSEKEVVLAFVHDTVEDVPGVTNEMIMSLFGNEVAKGLAYLTNVDKRFGNRKQRAEQDRLRLSCAPGWAQNVKILDIIDNVSTIVLHDPGYAPKYLLEKSLTLDVLFEADLGLIQKAENLIEALMRQCNVRRSRAMHEDCDAAQIEAIQ